MRPVTEKDRLVYAARLANDFKFFIKELWDDRGYSNVAPLGEMEYDICDWIVNGPTRRGTLSWRSAGKSHWACAYAAWRLYNDPDTKILLVSKSKIPHARDNARLIRGWLTNVWFLEHLNPRDNESGLTTDQTFQFDVNGSVDGRYPSVLAQGIEGMITGSRAHVVIADDVETPDNSKTVGGRKELSDKVKEFFNVAKFGSGDILYFGTYHHEESLYLKLARLRTERGEPSYVFRTWPMTYPLPGERFVGLAPLIQSKLDDGTGLPGAPTFSHRITPRHVDEAKTEGETNWKMQYQLVSEIIGGHHRPLKISDLIVFPAGRDEAPMSITWGTVNERSGTTMIDMPIVGSESDRLYGPATFDKALGPYTGTKAYIDPAGAGTDMTGLAIIGHLAGMLFVKGVYGLPGGITNDRLDEIARLCRTHGVNEVFVEINIDAFNTYLPAIELAMRRHHVDPGADPLLPGGWTCSVERRHSGGVQKEERIISALEPVMSTHRLVVHPDALMPSPIEPRENELQFQLSFLRKERKCLREDGKIDALAGCIKEWMEVLRMDPTRAAKITRIRALDKELREHFRASGVKVEEPRYFRN